MCQLHVPSFFDEASRNEKMGNKESKKEKQVEKKEAKQEERPKLEEFVGQVKESLNDEDKIKRFRAFAKKQEDKFILSAIMFWEHVEKRRSVFTSGQVPFPLFLEYKPLIFS